MNRFLSIAFCLLCNNIFGQSLKGTLTGAEGRIIYLQSYNGYLSKTIDSVIVSSNSEFSIDFPPNTYYGLYRLLLSNHTDPAQQIYIDLFYNEKDVKVQTSIEQPFLFLSFTDSLNKPFGETVKQIYQSHTRLELLEDILEYYPASEFKELTIKEWNAVLANLTNTFQNFPKENPDHPAIGYFNFREKTDPFLNPFPDKNFNKNIISHIDLSYPELARDPQPNRYFAAVFNHYYPVGAGRAEALNYMELFTKAVIDVTDVNPLLQENILDFLIKGYEQMGAFELIENISALTSNETCEDEQESHIKKGGTNGKRILPGEQAPDFSAINEKGNQVNLKDFENKPVIIIFWSPECTHCVEDLPKWKPYQKLFDQNGLISIGVSLSKDKKKWQQFSKESFPFNVNLIDEEGWNGRVALDYKVVSTPTIYLLDQNHKIIGRYRHIQYAYAAFLKSK